MPKIRLTQPGFENYSGQMGLLDFVDGLSTKDVDDRKAIRLSAVMLCEWEEGGNPSVTQSLLDNSDTPAPTQSNAQDGSQHDLEAKNLKDMTSTVATSSPLDEVIVALDAEEKSEPRLTREELEAIADKSGIKGLRDIAEPRGIKSNSINELIAAILKAG